MAFFFQINCKIPIFRLKYSYTFYLSVVMSLAFIEALKYLFLGIVQGVTEVLPISSSGHVEISRYILKIDFADNILFLIIVNTGSLFTFIFLYRERLLRLITSFFVYIFNKAKRDSVKSDFVYILKIIVAIIPAGLVGLILEDTINDILSTHGLLLVGIGLLLTATVLYYITREEPFDSKRKNLSWTDIVLMGLAQSVALIPGVSRSGMTSSAALKRGNSVESALDFSFIIYIPVSIGSILLMFIDIFRGEKVVYENNQIFLYLLAFLGAMIATYIAYKLIFNIFKSGKIKYFSYYCFGASAFAILLYIL